MMRLLLIYNPYAGKGRAALALAEIVDGLTTQGYLVTSYPTQGPQDAGEMITRYGSSYDRIVIAGGDGTLNDAVGGLLRLPDAPPLGYLPMGSANDFSKNLSLPSTLAEQVQVAGGGVLRPCDAGSFNGRPFVYVAAFGAFTDVSFNTPQRSKNMFGQTAYIIESIKRLPSIKPHEIEVDFDGGSISGEFLYGMISNTSTVGGIAQFPPCPMELNDGLFELTLVSPARDLLEFESFMRLLLTGNLDTSHPMLHLHSTTQVQLRSKAELLWALDGENGGTSTSADIRVLPSAFQIAHGA